MHHLRQHTDDDAHEGTRGWAAGDTASSAPSNVLDSQGGASLLDELLGQYGTGNGRQYGTVGGRTGTEEGPPYARDASSSLLSMMDAYGGDDDATLMAHVLAGADGDGTDRVPGAAPGQAATRAARPVARARTPSKGRITSGSARAVGSGGGAAATAGGSSSPARRVASGRVRHVSAGSSSLLAPAPAAAAAAHAAAGARPVSVGRQRANLLSTLKQQQQQQQQQYEPQRRRPSLAALPYEAGGELGAAADLEPWGPSAASAGPPLNLRDLPAGALQRIERMQVGAAVAAAAAATAAAAPVVAWLRSPQGGSSIGGAEAASAASNDAATSSPGQVGAWGGAVAGGVGRSPRGVLTPPDPPAGARRSSRSSSTDGAGAPLGAAASHSTSPGAHAAQADPAASLPARSPAPAQGVRGNPAAAAAPRPALPPPPPGLDEAALPSSGPLVRQLVMLLQAQSLKIESLQSSVASLTSAAVDRRGGGGSPVPGAKQQQQQQHQKQPQPRPNGPTLQQLAHAGSGEGLTPRHRIAVTLHDSAASLRRAVAAGPAGGSDAETDRDRSAWGSTAAWAPVQQQQQGQLGQQQAQQQGQQQGQQGQEEKAGGGGHPVGPDGAAASFVAAAPETAAATSRLLQAEVAELRQQVLNLTHAMMAVQQQQQQQQGEQPWQQEVAVLGRALAGRTDQAAQRLGQQLQDATASACSTLEAQQVRWQQQAAEQLRSQQLGWQQQAAAQAGAQQHTLGEHRSLLSMHHQCLETLEARTAAAAEATRVTHEQLQQTQQQQRQWQGDGAGGDGTSARAVDQLAGLQQQQEQQLQEQEQQLQEQEQQLAEVQRRQQQQAAEVRALQQQLAAALAREREREAAAAMPTPGPSVAGDDDPRGGQQRQQRCRGREELERDEPEGAAAAAAAAAAAEGAYHDGEGEGGGGGWQVAAVGVLRVAAELAEHRDSSRTAMEQLAKGMEHIAALMLASLPPLTEPNEGDAGGGGGGGGGGTAVAVVAAAAGSGSPGASPARRGRGSPSPSPRGVVAAASGGGAAASALHDVRRQLRALQKEMRRMRAGMAAQALVAGVAPGAVRGGGGSRRGSAPTRQREEEAAVAAQEQQMMALMRHASASSPSGDGGWAGAGGAGGGAALLWRQLQGVQAEVAALRGGEALVLEALSRIQAQGEEIAELRSAVAAAAGGAGRRSHKPLLSGEGVMLLAMVRRHDAGPCGGNDEPQARGMAQTLILRPRELAPSQMNTAGASYVAQPGSLVFDCEVDGDRRVPGARGVDGAAAHKSKERLAQDIEKLQWFAAPANAFSGKLLRDVRYFIGDDVVEPDVVVLGAKLSSCGYGVNVRTALGGGSACFRNLRHEFLTVRGLGEYEGVEFIVDPSFRQHFVIHHPTEEYAQLLTAAPDVFVGTSARLVPIVQTLCALMVESFERQGLTLPPWRRTQSMLSKWLPNRARDTCFSRASAPPHAEDFQRSHASGDDQPPAAPAFAASVAAPRTAGSPFSRISDPAQQHLQHSGSPAQQQQQHPQQQPWSLLQQPSAQGPAHHGGGDGGGRGLVRRQDSGYGTADFIPFGGAGGHASDTEGPSPPAPGVMYVPPPRGTVPGLGSVVGAGAGGGASAWACGPRRGASGQQHGLLATRLQQQGGSVCGSARQARPAAQPHWAPASPHQVQVTSEASAPSPEHAAAMDAANALGCKLAELAAPLPGFCAKVHRDVTEVLAQFPAGAGAGGEAESLLATGLKRLGHACAIRVALGGGGACFRALRHQFLVVRGSGEFAGVELIVEPSLRQHFAIPQASPEYALALSHAPDVFVGGSCRLVPIVQLLCALMADSFQRQGLAVPPWRREQAMLSKWLPCPTRAREYTPTHDCGAAAVARSGAGPTQQASARLPILPVAHSPVTAAAPWPESPASELHMLLTPQADGLTEASACSHAMPPRRRPDSDPSIAARGFGSALLMASGWAAAAKAASSPPSPLCGISGASHSGALFLSNEVSKSAAGRRAAAAPASGRVRGFDRVSIEEEDDADTFVDACPAPGAAAGGGGASRVRRGTDTGMLPAARCCGGAAPGLLSALMVLQATPGRAATATGGAGGGRLVTLPPAHARAPAIHTVHRGWPVAA
ncbi:hypothetical protein TSOC_010738 [Tetrabaena socialis]|uniref:Uncharacterized protein n=1 Tax=Tetrabaena socialis TaxID=47790 RepID=A0A2J7ZSI0_9CHLO|nr:hypothetical protein TSOC_010738 [Tetrabaena socialis]|eukprot:PNH03227.1 hypothetical protein TSOC_010738 [Tetrabaena socialis]